MPIQIFPQLNLPSAPQAPAPDILNRAHADLYEAEAQKTALQNQKTRRINEAGLQAAATAEKEGRAQDTDQLMQDIIPRVSAIDPEKGAAIWNTYNEARQHKLDADTAEANHRLTTVLQGVQLAAAGAKPEGLSLVNQFARKGQTVTDIASLGNGSHRVTMEDGSTRVINEDALVKSLVDSKTQFNAKQELLRASLRLQKEFGPEGLKAGEYVTSSGTKIPASDVFRLFNSASANAMAQFTATQLGSSTPEQKEQARAALDSLKDPATWAKKTLDVDITGKETAALTSPGKSVGGKLGTLVPKPPQEAAAASQKSLAESHGYTYDPAMEYKLDEQGNLMHRPKAK